MRDQYDRSIDYMRISVTDRCNLRCKYCMPEGIEKVSMQQILTYEQMEEICECAAETGIRKIKVTGGEPLVRKGCVPFIGRLKAIPGIEQVTMTSNGMLLADCLEELKRQGLDAVNISLDTLNPQKYRWITGQDGLEKVMESIRKSIALGIRTKINTVVQRGINDTELLDIAELSRGQKLDVRFIEMMPIGFGKRFAPVSNEEVLKMIKDVHPDLTGDSTVHGNGPAVYYRIPGYQGSIGLISALHGKFCGSCNRIRLTAQGKVKPCLCYAKTFDLWEILKEQDGGVRREQIRECLISAIRSKPQNHCFECPEEVSERNEMVRIGG